MLCAQPPAYSRRRGAGACSLDGLVALSSRRLAVLALSRRAGLALFGLVALAPRSARAEDPGGAEIAARLAYVVAALEREEAPARTWSDGWTFAFAGLAVTQGALALTTTDPGVRAATIAGCIKSGIGFAARVALPVTARGAATSLRAMRADLPGARRAKLRAAESLLSQSAQEERFGHSWVPLGLGLALNVSSTFILWAGYHRAGAGWFGLGAATAVSQLQFWTQPTGAITAWEAYTRGAWRAPPRPAAVRWSLTPAGKGLAVQGTF